MPQRKYQTVTVLILLTVVTFSLSSIFVSALDATVETQYVGSPISETTFSDLSSTQPCTAMYPGSAIQITDDSVKMEIEYNESEMVNLTVAESSARLFMNQFDYLSSLNFTLDQGWVRLEAGKWYLRFNSNSADTYFGVNAVTSFVTNYGVHWVGPSPYVRDIDSDILSISDIELAAKQFFVQNNLTLTPTTHYTTATIEYDTRYLTHNVYAIRFFEVMNESLVDGNIVAIYLDIVTGTVVNFKYQWVFVDEVPVDDTINKSAGIDHALNYIAQESNSFNVRISYANRLIKDFKENGSVSYYLCWAVYTDHSEFAVIYVNAKNGEIISTEEYAIISAFVENTRLNLVLLIYPFILSIPIATIAYFITKYLSKEK